VTEYELLLVVDEEIVLGAFSSFGGFGITCPKALLDKNKIVNVVKNKFFILFFKRLLGYKYQYEL
tara:strand:- start:167 stop:361 length:195 start_codon:yes stop_codon:yes gene_type:complete